LSRNEPHDEFLELSAVSTAGQLSEEEQKRLEDHLAVCPACRVALREYEAVIDQAIPGIAAEEVESVSPGPGWSQSRAEKAFFKRLAEEENTESGTVRDTHGFSNDSRHVVPFSDGPTWRQVWMLCAAGILLILSLSFYAYRVHTRLPEDHGESIRKQVAVEPPRSPSLEEQLSDAGHERALAREEIRQRDELITGLRRQLADESASIAQMKNVQERLQNEIQTKEAGREDLAQKQSELGLKLEASESNTRSLQQKVNALAEESAEDSARAKSLEAKNRDLTKLLEDREAELERQDQLLAHDKDIRDLMSARDLYIAEVYDIARTGETRKPYGRVFYTRGKSLIFYAYDLDRETEAKSTSSFQVWGRRGPDHQQAVNLGIFYVDNHAQKRWMLKCEDPKTLAHIDGVFVTVEPSGGSPRPSGKSLLSAYLKLNPNHP
jgi:hypothetical protein